MDGHELTTSRRRRVLLLLSATVVLGSCGRPPPPTDSGGLRTFDEGGLTFRYPDAWQEFHHSVVSSFSMSVADLGTVDVPEPCISRPNALGGSDTDCADRFRLTPNTLVVHVMTNGFPGFDISRSRPADATALVVGGRPAFVERRAPDNPAVGADVVITWTLSQPDAPDNFFTITALIRGPNAASLEDQLQRMIASLGFKQP